MASMSRWEVMRIERCNGRKVGGIHRWQAAQPMATVFIAPTSGLMLQLQHEILQTPFETEATKHKRYHCCLLLSIRLPPHTHQFQQLSSRFPSHTASFDGRSTTTIRLMHDGWHWLLCGSNGYYSEGSNIGLLQQ
eukprot:scaffold16159_cov125-Skeletonema_dohrnii-CCMP3373.AAC.2